MIDLHCHILPDLDDGPATLDEAVEMCRIAAADGISTIVATPHYWPGWFESTAESRSSRLEALREGISREGIAMTILQGAELTVFPELPDLLEREPELTLNGTGKYFLVELPFQTEPLQWEAFLRSLLAAGRVPVLAHPERSAWLRRKPEKVLQFVKEGGRVQITGGSVLGEEGKDAREFASLLLQHRLVHVISSDAHSAVERMPRLSDAVQAAAEVVDRSYAADLVSRYPAEIIAGGAVSAPQPREVAYAQTERPAKRWFFFK